VSSPYNPNGITAVLLKPDSANKPHIFLPMATVHQCMLQEDIVYASSVTWPEWILLFMLNLLRQGSLSGFKGLCIPVQVPAGLIVLDANSQPLNSVPLFALPVVAIVRF